MLEPVSLGQTRTHCPGLAADERGVFIGRRLVLLFPDVAFTVGFFRSYSREVNLDEILSSLRIVETISERGGREMCVTFDVASSYVADRAALAARMHRGRVFTGSETHYVPYRDKRNPLGYDLAGAGDLITDTPDLVLYQDQGGDRRRFGRAIKIEDLIVGLSPRPLTSHEREQENHTTLVVRCERGLIKPLCRYLWSRRVSAKINTAVSAKKRIFSSSQTEIALVTCEQIPRHIAKLLANTPGMRVFVPYHDRLFVEYGFRHPIALESAGQAFSGDDTILFWGPPNKVERLQAQEQAVDIKDLVDVSVHGREGVIEAPKELSTMNLDALDVELRLAHTPKAKAATTALLIDAERVPWFKKLVYMLPAAILKSYEAAIVDDMVIVVNRRGIHGIPFGEPMNESYPQVFLPIDMQLLPRVDYELLREHLQIRPEENLYFFPEHKTPFSIPIASLKPLSRAVVAPERARANIIEMRSRDLVTTLPMPELAYLKQDTFSLWRGARVQLDDDAPALAAPKKTKQLAKPASPSSEITTPDGDPES